MVSTRRQTALGQTSTNIDTQTIAPQGVSRASVAVDSDGHSNSEDAATPTASTDERDPGSSENPTVPLAGRTMGSTAPKRVVKRKKGKWSAAMKKDALLARETKRSLLRSFMQLPLDVILEMFSHLHPRALLSIARTSKELRAMVLSPKHADMWKNAREEAGVPRPPEGLSEPRWASLLFDTNYCQVCWNKVDTEVNWYFLRRACEKCIQRHTVRLPPPRHGFLYDDETVRKPMLDFVDNEVVEYIPWGHFGYQTNTQPVHFWDDDAVDIANAWQEFSKHTDPASRKAFHLWKMRRREIIQKNLNLVPTYQLWMTNCLYPSKRLIKHRENRLVGERKHKAVQEIKNRLREAGHRTEDIEMSTLLYPSPYLLGSGDVVSDGEWERMAPFFEADVEKLKDFRVTLEMELVIQERFSVFGGVYETFLRTLPPSERYRCPEVSSFRIDKDVVAILEANENIEVTRSHFHPIANKMRAIIDQAHNELKQNLRNAAPHPFGPHGQPWLLAANVFTRFHRTDIGLLRAEDGVLVDWDMIATHRHDGHSTTWLRPGVPVRVPRAFNYNHPSSVNSRRLVALAGLPLGVTVTELDERDPRFSWENEGESGGSMTVFNWRAMLAYLYVNELRATGGRPRLATEKEKSAAKAFEATAQQQAKAWACNHCPQYLQAPDADTKPAILAHLAEEHGVTEPEMLTDYFINERCRYAYEVPYRT